MGCAAETSETKKTVNHLDPQLCTIRVANIIALAAPQLTVARVAPRSARCARRCAINALQLSRRTTAGRATSRVCHRPCFGHSLFAAPSAHNKAKPRLAHSFLALKRGR
jgi:hypothetical protein